MRSVFFLAIVLASMALVGLPGCGNNSQKPAAPKSPVGEKVPEAGPAAPAELPAQSPETAATTKTALPAAPVEPPPPPPAAVPTVVLTESMRAMCRVQVGDAMPAGSLTAPGGAVRSMSELLGKRATVVLFYDHGRTEETRALATDALSYLADDVQKPFAPRGVAVVAVNVGAPAQAVQPDAATLNYPVLADPNGECFAKVATERLPRVYVLDASGRIVWFDMEFSRTTRRDLNRVLRALE